MVLPKTETCSFEGSRSSVVLLGGHREGASPRPGVLGWLLLSSISEGFIEGTR